MNQGNHYDSTPSIPMKRRRGRPRKDLHQIHGRSSDGLYRSLSQNHGGKAGVRSGCERTKATGDADDAMVGVAVSGVIEAAFDAGYLLSVRIGDSDNHLRGVVFKPGHYLPVSMKNDVAPHVQMIRRNEIPFSSTIRTPVCSAISHSRGRNQHHMVYPLSVSPPSDQLVKIDIQSSIIPVQPPPRTGSIENVVPLIDSQPAHFVASKAVLVHSPSDYGLTSPHEATPKSSQTNNSSPSQSMESTHQVDISTAVSPVNPFHQLANEVPKRIEEISGPVETERTKSTAMTSPEASELTAEHIRDLSQPLLPFQAVQSDTPDQSVSITQPRTGKMTELLLAMQEKVEKQTAGAPQVEDENQGN